ncbi:transposase [Pleionea sp. CnH1-48]|uniref:transposase n=1 Tax=Pleionea sp. CnH1-48 TaxID=2954494 RepID=UPI002097F8B7|nr:transposase [Pleionea sp. CnH1-48]MCO7223529.1 transposase [Pleionea sp. CnH1-48]
MTIARKELVDSHSPGFYHCSTRCVRRAFLCGVNEETGKDYSHRKDWIERRIKELSTLFSIDIYAYAVMSNHYHIVLYLDPLAPLQWSNDEVAERWLAIYPSKTDVRRTLRKQAILNSPKTLALYRQRLGSLSWFMSRLNEPLAKLSNQEDDCNGKFWQSRYTSQALLDEGAVLSCMAYVDLNPVRAKITQKLEESHHTSIKQRLNDITDDKSLNETLLPVSGSVKQITQNISNRDYINLVEWAGKAIVHPNKASIPKEAQSVLERLNLQSNHWLTQLQSLESRYCRVIGPVEFIRQRAKKLYRRCLHGISSAKLLYS